MVPVVVPIAEMLPSVISLRFIRCVLDYRCLSTIAAVPIVVIIIKQRNVDSTVADYVLQHQRYQLQPTPHYRFFYLHHSHHFYQCYYDFKAE